MKKRAIILISVISVWFSIQIDAQVAPQKYFVEFMDKANSPYSVSRPNEFLSDRSISRRQKQGIAIVEEDLPVNTAYVDRVRIFANSILTRSKWFNGVTISCLNPALVDSIRLLPFVKKIVKNTFQTNNTTNYKSVNKFDIEESLLEHNVQVYLSENMGYNVNSTYNYGPSFRQVHMLNGDSLHNMGYRGQGLVIAILDGGFFNVDQLVAFDSLWDNNQILGTKDFVVPGNDVFIESPHGMEVLSCMGGNIPGLLIGTAPKASYWLLRSEDVRSENLIEEYNWVAASEFADSAGADIINSSLGYTQFDDVTKNHTCSDMNGNTTPVTRGANLAFNKGMIVINSAGNSGGSSWKCVSAPADGFNLLAVASVDSNGVRAGSSSVGEATQRIKPNVAAMGVSTVVSSPVGTIMRASGTSFSSPLIAGMVACLWQAAPDWSNELIKRAVELSSSRAVSPDSLTGYGIPDFVKALKNVSAPDARTEKPLTLYPNPFSNRLMLSAYSAGEQEIEISVRDQQGRVIYSLQKQSVRAGENSIPLTKLSLFPNGIYFITVTGNNFTSTSKVTKINY